MVLVKQMRDCRIVIRDYGVIKPRIKAELFKKSINSFEDAAVRTLDRVEVMGLTNHYVLGKVYEIRVINKTLLGTYRFVQYKM